MEKSMKVLSLFDGCGMAYQALKNLNMKVDKYYASEIDKWAIQIAKKNHPDIIHIGDIKDVNAEDYTDIDLIIAGFPCQSFSIAGNRLNFEDDRGQLFFKALEILKQVNPKYYIFENVASMKKDIQAEISKLIGVEPIKINSALVSAQQRKRLYWTNMEVEQPKNKKIYFKDVLQPDVDEEYLHSEKAVKYMNRKTKNGRSHFDFGYVHDIRKNKSKCLVANLYKGVPYNVLILENRKIRKLTPIECERLQTLPDGYTEGVSDTQRYKMLGNGFTVAVIEQILSFIQEIKAFSRGYEKGYQKSIKTMKKRGVR